MARSSSRRIVLIWIVGLALWLGSAGAGLFWLMAYDNTPGAIADAPAGWPSASALTRDPNAPTLVMLAHPRCDCTRASLGELEELLARVKVKPRTFVVFIKPGGVGQRLGTVGHVGAREADSRRHRRA